MDFSSGTPHAKEKKNIGNDPDPDHNPDIGTF